MGKLKDTTEILQEIKDFVGEGGTVAFEHGFHKPTFKFEGFKHRCNMVSEKVAYCIRYYGNGSGEKRTCNLPLSRLNYSTLKSMLTSMKKYLEYCQKFA
jgi:hypothetical protein